LVRKIPKRTFPGNDILDDFGPLLPRATVALDKRQDQILLLLVVHEVVVGIVVPDYRSNVLHEEHNPQLVLEGIAFNGGEHEHQEGLFGFESEHSELVALLSSGGQSLHSLGRRRRCLLRLRLDSYAVIAARNAG
jgi:hypothetical protein